MTIGDSPGDLLTRLCSSAASLFIAAPYIKAQALSKVLAALHVDASLICVTRWIPHDLATGASDTECRKLVNDFGGSFLLHPTLHAKYYRIDDTILVGSANLTSSAMGWAPQPNLEILCQAGDDFDSLAFQQELLAHAREIGDDEFLRWEAIPKMLAPIDKAVLAQQPRLDTWRPKTRYPIHLELSYGGREHDIASDDEQQAARMDLEALMMPSSLSNEGVRAWATTCLLATPFANTVIQLNRTSDVTVAQRALAGTFGLSMTEARRDMETVQNWLTLLAPETIRDIPQ